MVMPNFLLIGSQSAGTTSVANACAYRVEAEYVSFRSPGGARSAALNGRSSSSATTLQAFECAARHGSFTQAAAELNLTQSAVSRQIKDLENELATNSVR